MLIRLEIGEMGRECFFRTVELRWCYLILLSIHTHSHTCMHVHNVIERAALISLSFSFSHMVIPASDGALGKYYGPVRRKVPVEFFVIVYPHLSRRGPVMIHQKALVSCQAPSSSSPVHRQAIKLHLYFSSESDRSCLPLRHWPVTI